MANLILIPAEDTSYNAKERPSGVTTGVEVFRFRKEHLDDIATISNRDKILLYLGATKDKNVFDAIKKSLKAEARTAIVDQKIDEYNMLYDNLANYLLSLIHSLYWKTDCLNAAGGDNWTNCERSPYDIYDILKMIEPIIAPLQNIYDTIIETKFPNVLVNASIKQNISHRNIEEKLSTDPTKLVEKGASKKKKNQP